MKHSTLSTAIAAAILAALPPSILAQAPADLTIQSDAGRVVITNAGKPVATYVYRDAKIPRPYFAHVHAPGSVQVTRNHPPIAGKDATDHAEFHLGLWLAFGDLGGADSWRLKARVQHDKFFQEPKAGGDSATFGVSNFYLSNDGKRVICGENCRYTILVKPGGYLLLWDSLFQAKDGDLAFCDQEEMGLGVRVATPISVKGGGRILTSDGHKNEKQVRAKTSAWADYSGTIEGRRAGVTLMQHPKNFRPAWYHARDYGLLVLNHFGRRDLTGGEKSRVLLKQGETFRLRFGVFLDAGAEAANLDPAAAYKDYLKVAGGP